MHKFLSKLAKKFRYLRGYLKVTLPVGVKEFDEFCTSIFSVYDLPDLPSYRNAIATMIMHLPATVSAKAPVFFAVSIKKAMANQIAYEVIQQIRQEQKKLEQGEATPKLEAAPDESIPNQEV